MKKLEVLNTEMHRRRQSQQSLYRLDSRKSFSTGNSPEPIRTRLDVRDRQRGGSGNFVGGAGASDTESINSLHLGDLKDQFSGSTGSLPSIGASSVSEASPSPSPDSPSTDEDNPVMIKQDDRGAATEHNTALSNDLPGISINSESTRNCTVKSNEIEPDVVEAVASRLVKQTLTTAIAKLEGEESTIDPLQLALKS